jgi:leucyl aminopeptidase
MEFKKESGTLSRVKSDVLVLGVFQGEAVAKLIAKLDKVFPSDFLKEIDSAASAESFEGKFGQTLALPSYGRLKCRKLMLWGLGKSADFQPNFCRRTAANMARRASGGGASGTVCFHLRAAEDQALYLQAAVEGWILGSYTFQKYKSNGDHNGKRAKVKLVTFAGLSVSPAELTQAVKFGSVIAESTNFARDLIAEPAGYMTPSRLAQEAKRVAKENGLTCLVMDRAEMEKNGMGALLGVAQGANEPPKFIVLKYVASKAKRTVALVGKGITFDSGGLSLKTAQGMEHMKYDMAGAAAVIATVSAIGRLKPRVNVLGLIAATENMPGGKALHPGDVLVAMNGKTIEVNNTDAEGRLVLADALNYAVKQGPDEIVDIATLTGGIVTALGRAAAGIMGNDQDLVGKLIDSAESAGERLWQMPLFDEYKDYLKSDIADLKNAGSRGEAASSAGGMFLKEFVDGTPWAHLDIAGPGWMDKEKDETNKGGTAFGVRTLCRYILTQ